MTATDTHLDERPRGATPEAPSWRARARRLLTPAPGPELAPSERPPLPDPVWLGKIRRHVVLALSALAGLIGGGLIVVTAPVFYLAAPSWRLTIPGVPHPGTPAFSTTTFVIGLVLMGLGWMGLIGRASRQLGSERRRLTIVLAVFGLWMVPFLLGPPLLSNDVYSYVAQGELASRGIDPSSHGPVYLKVGPSMQAADSIWRNSPAPYGPVWIELSEAIVEVTGHDAAASVWGFRAVAVIGVAMAAVGAALLARSYGLSPAVALAMGLANPLVLLHLVGGAHNDAFMVGLLLLALAAFRHDRKHLAVVLVALATAVKLPAALALVFIGWNWRPAVTSLWRRASSAAACLAAGVGIVGALTVLAGMGAGWLFALEGTNKITSTYSVTTKLGFVIHDLLGFVGLQLDQTMVVNGFRLVGLGVAGLIVLALLLQSPRIGVARGVGLGLLVVILLGPVVWPWYLPASFAILAAVGLGRYRVAYLVIAFAVTLTVFPTSVKPVVRLDGYEHLGVLGLVVLTLLVAFGAQRFADWAYGRRRRKLGLDLYDELESGLEDGSQPPVVDHGGASAPTPAMPA